MSKHWKRMRLGIAVTAMLALQALAGPLALAGWYWRGPL
jgi:hypothetical protein